MAISTASRIRVEFVAKLRDEEKFDDLPALVKQMDRMPGRRAACCGTITNELGVSA